MVSLGQVRLAVAALVASAAVPVAAAAPPAPADPVDAASTAHVLPLTSFEHAMPGQPPAGWKVLGGKIEDVYVVREEPDGRRYLHADARGSAVIIGKEELCDIRRYPILTWRWRVLALPTGGDERRRETGDSAAAVYVVFGGWPIPRTVAYVWSSSLPPGTRTRSPFTGETGIVVLESGPAKAGEWVEERANVLEDYRLFFGKDPDRARGVAVLSDADDTRSRAVADYDAIVARPAGGAAALSGQRAGASGARAARADTRP